MLEKLFENFRTFLEEDQLIESRLTDTKDKYPDISEFVDYFSQNDPSGKNKYLMWMAKTLDQEARGMTKEAQKDVAEQAVKLVKSFHKNQKRLSKKDINQYKSFQDLEKDLSSLGVTQKEKRSKEKEEAIEGSEIVHQDENFFIVSPNTKESSCYYGKGTQWCISATRSENYFDRYTQEGKVFYFLRNENLPEDHKGRKLAFVFGGSGLEEIYNALDQRILEQEATEHIMENMFGEEEESKEKFIEARDIFDNLVEEMGDHLEDNPPDYTHIEEEIEKIKNEFNKDSKNIFVDYDFYGDSISDVSFDGYMSFDLNALGFKLAVDIDDIDKEKIKNVLFRAHTGWANIYPDDIDFQFYNDEYMVQFSFSKKDPYGAPGPPIERFKSFVSDLEEYGENYEEFINKLEDELSKQGLLKSSTTETLQSWLRIAKQDVYKNMKVEVDGTDLDFYMDLRISISEKRLSNDVYEIIRSSAFQQTFQQNIINYLSQMNKMLAKQMKLFENRKTHREVAAVVPELIIFDVKRQENSIVSTLYFSIDAKQLSDSIEAERFIRVMKWFDEKHDNIEDIYIKIIRQSLKELDNNLRESTKYSSFYSSWNKYLKK